jgi:P27 family predicted phage terminase small subunit
MPRGRPPTPTRLKILRGNPGKRPLNQAEPQPAARMPTCPDWLDDAAREKWAELAPELFRLGLLTAIDGDALAGYCQAWAEFKAATQTLRGTDRTIMTEKGNTIAHPAVGIQRGAMERMRAFGAPFGLDPSSRSRLKPASAGDTPRDPFEDFLGKAG